MAQLFTPEEQGVQSTTMDFLPIAKLFGLGLLGAGAVKGASKLGSKLDKSIEKASLPDNVSKNFSDTYLSFIKRDLGDEGIAKLDKGIANLKKSGMSDAEASKEALKHMYWDGGANVKLFSSDADKAFARIDAGTKAIKDAGVPKSSTFGSAGKQYKELPADPKEHYKTMQMLRAEAGKLRGSTGMSEREISDAITKQYGYKFESDYL